MVSGRQLGSTACSERTRTDLAGCGARVDQCGRCKLIIFVELAVSRNVTAAAIQRHSRHSQLASLLINRQFMQT